MKIKLQVSLFILVVIKKQKEILQPENFFDRKTDPQENSNITNVAENKELISELSKWIV